MNMLTYKKKQILLHILLFLLLCSLLYLATACTAEDLRTSTLGGDVVEGETTTLLLKLKSSEMEQRTRATHPNEEEIVSLAVFIFDLNTKILVSSTFHATIASHIEGDGSIAIETLTGNNHAIYAIANYDAGIIEDLKAISTVEQLNAATFRIDANPLAREFGLIKIGVVSDTPVRQGTRIEIALAYMSAKITLNVINRYDGFEVEGWTVGNIPTRSYVMERATSPTDPNYHDASNINSDNDYFNDFADQNFPFETAPATPGVGNATTPLNYSSTFYMVENRRGGRVTRDAPPAGWPYGTVADGPRAPYQEKAWYAPLRASYLRIYGKRTLAGGGKELVIINHYLGNDDTADYNIDRSTHYTYNVTINSMSSININTNVEKQDIELRVTTPADLMNMDAHYGFRQFMVFTGDITNPDHRVSVEVLTAINSDVASSWLNISPVPTVTQHVKTSTPVEIAQWQQDGGTDGDFVRPKFIPNKATRTALTAAGRAYVPPTGIIFPSTEYPEADDEALTYHLTGHRMCKKITDIPTKGMDLDPGTFPAAIPMLLYADEYPYNDAVNATAYREAVIRFTLTTTLTDEDDEEKKSVVVLKQVHFNVRQYPPLRFVQLPGQAETLLVERIEEYASMLQPFSPVNFQMLAGLQWGPARSEGLAPAIDIDNGTTNTLWGVYTDPTNGERSADHMLPRYGSGAGGWNTNADGLIPAPYMGGTQGQPYYKLPNQNDPNHINIIYNITAARYCHEKNWDTNGNGNIDPEETNWYLPATVELQQFWTYRELLSLVPDYYWSSVQASQTDAYAFSMLPGTADAHRTFNGVQQPIGKRGVAGVNRPRVRCVRRVPTSQATPVAPIVQQRLDGTVVIDCASLPGTVYTTQSKNGVQQSNIGAIQLTNDKLYKRFEVSRTQPSSNSYYELYAGNGLCNKSQGWRLPTQREMLLIWSVKNKLEALSGFDAFKTTDTDNRYWTMTRDLNNRYLVDFKTGISEIRPFEGLSAPHFYRCVRELP